LYEREYSDQATYLPSAVGAERIRTLEMVLDQRISDELLASASVFDIVADDLIRLEPAGGDLVQFRNAGSITSRGVEVRLDYRRASGVWSYISGSYQRATEAGDRIQNSPLSIIHIGLSTPTAARVFGAIEGGYEAGRITRSGATTNGATLVNVRAAVRITRDLQVAVTVRNAADTDHALPAGPLLAQNVLEGSGRTFLLTLKVGGR
jgi:outer membrane receptor protein involved in Fe transport